MTWVFYDSWAESDRKNAHDKVEQKYYQGTPIFMSENNTSLTEPLLYTERF